MRIIWKTVRRITNELLGVKGLKENSLFLHSSEVRKELISCNLWLTRF